MKELIVKNNDKFYSKLFWYKSFLYKNTKFIPNNEKKDDIEFNSIINALNIKNRKKRIEYIYDYCCNKIDENNKGKNICGFNNNSHCYSQQRPNCDFKNGCCRLCALQNSKGCQTSNLACKLYYCSEVTSRYNVIKYKDLKILKLYTLRQRLILQYDYFINRKDFLKDLYSNSLIIYGIRTSFRIIINFIKLRKIK